MEENNFLKSLCCCVCGNNYETDLLTFFRGNLLCLACQDEWIKRRHEFKSFEAFIEIFRKELEKDRTEFEDRK